MDDSPQVKAIKQNVNALAELIHGNLTFIANDLKGKRLLDEQDYDRVVDTKTTPPLEIANDLLRRIITQVERAPTLYQDFYNVLEKYLNPQVLLETLPKPEAPRNVPDDPCQKLAEDNSGTVVKLLPEAYSEDPKSGSESDPECGFCCGCGKCDLATYLEKGCPSLPDSDFPLLFPKKQHAIEVIEEQMDWNQGDAKLATKGKDCAAMARKAVQEINQGKAKDASVKLDGLKIQGTELAEQAKDLANRLEKVQECNQKLEKETQQKIEEYGHREQELQSQMNDIQANLNSQHSFLEAKCSDLSRAQNSLSNAERKRREKEKEADRIRIVGTVGGVLIGIFTGGIGGAIVGGAMGAGVGQMINKLREQEARTQREVDRCRIECSNAESSISSSEQQISSIQSQISSLSSQLTHMKQQLLKYHEEAEKYKKAIVFLKDAVHFWLFFKQLSDHGVDRASLLQKIVDKAESKTDLSLLQRDASKRVATTFLDAWEELESMTEDEGSQHMIQMDFKCTKCNGNYTDLPYVKQNEVICKHCYHQHALT